MKNPTAVENMGSQGGGVLGGASDLLSGAELYKGPVRQVLLCLIIQGLSGRPSILRTLSTVTPSLPFFTTLRHPASPAMTPQRNSKAGRSSKGSKIPSTLTMSSPRPLSLTPASSILVLPSVGTVGLRLNPSSGSKRFTTSGNAQQRDDRSDKKDAPVALHSFGSPPPDPPDDSDDGLKKPPARYSSSDGSGTAGTNRTECDYPPCACFIRGSPTDEQK